MLSILTAYNPQAVQAAEPVYEPNFQSWQNVGTTLEYEYLSYAKSQLLGQSSEGQLKMKVTAEVKEVTKTEVKMEITLQVLESKVSEWPEGTVKTLSQIYPIEGYPILVEDEAYIL